jgi:hypothetical protein
MRSILLVAVALTGCASDAAYLAYLDAQRTANATAYAQHKPLLELIGHDGQPITGLAAIRVNLPIEVPRVEQQRPSEWAGIVDRGFMMLAPAVLAREVANGFTSGITAAGAANVAIAGNIQAPQASVTTTVQGNAVVGDGSMATVGRDGATGAGGYSIVTNEADSRNTATTPTTTTTSTTSTTTTSSSYNPSTNTTTTTPP